MVLDPLPPAEAVFRILFGSISGTDQLSINGKITGFTNLQTNPNGTAIAVRDYEIPASFFRKGPNEILLKIDYDFDSALGLRESTGAVNAPAELRMWTEKKAGRFSLREIDLEKMQWQGLSVGKAVSTPYQDLEKRDWRKIKVPGWIQTQHREWTGHTGYFWYRTEFQLKEEIPPHVNPVLLIGAADDEDKSISMAFKSAIPDGTTPRLTTGMSSAAIGFHENSSGQESTGFRFSATT